MSKNKPLLLTLLASWILFLSSCSYRIATPQQIPQGIHISISNNASRLTQTQSFLQQAVAKEIQRELSWPINQNAVNKLMLSIKAEEIDSSAKNSARITTRWQQRIHIEAQFHSPYIKNGRISKSFSASAGNSTLMNENNVVAAACDELARQLRMWLDHLPLDIP